MALTTHVTNRYGASSTLLIAITNQDNPAATTLNATVLGYAATDAQSWFKRLVNLTYDDTDADHIAVAVRAVVHLLKQWTDKYGDTMQAERDSIEADMKQLAKITARDRIQPATNSILEPTDEDVLDGPDRPLFDNERFRNITPDGPPAP